MKLYAAFILLFSSFSLFGQSLLESFRTEEKIKPYELNGFIKIYQFTDPKNDSSTVESRSIYSQTALCIDYKKDDWLKAYSEIRFSAGYEYAKAFTDLSIREAFIELKKKHFSIKAGKQIENWGRADAFNPTNLLIPKNQFLFTPDENEKLMSNYMLKFDVHILEQLNIKAIWIPIFEASVYPIEIMDLPPIVSFEENQFNRPSIEHSAISLKADLLFPSIEGSVSYFKGYDPLPLLKPTGIQTNEQNNPSFSFTKEIYRIQSLGMDFSTTLGKIGLRGEANWKKTENFTSENHIPNPEFNWVVGLESMLNLFRFNLNYTGKYVVDFVQIPVPGTLNPEEINPQSIPQVLELIDNQFKFYNQIISNQRHEYSHSFAANINFTNKYNNFQTELSGLYHSATEEFMIQAKISYNISDGLNFLIGASHFQGNENSTFNWLEPIFNGFFAELKLSF